MSIITAKVTNQLVPATKGNSHSLCNGTMMRTDVRFNTISRSFTTFFSCCFAFFSLSLSFLFNFSSRVLLTAGSCPLLLIVHGGTSRHLYYFHATMTSFITEARAYRSSRCDPMAFSAYKLCQFSECLNRELIGWVACEVRTCIR